MKLTRMQVRALKWAIGEAEVWRGTLTGNPDPIPLENFDAGIAHAKLALRAVQMEDPMLTLARKTLERIAYAPSTWPAKTLREEAAATLKVLR